MERSFSYSVVAFAIIISIVQADVVIPYGNHGTLDVVGDDVRFTPGTGRAPSNPIQHPSDAGVGLTNSDYSYIDPTAILQEGCRIGDYAYAGPRVNCGRKSKIGSYTTIDADVRVGDRMIVGNYSRIGSGTSIFGYVRAYVTIDQAVSINPYSIVDDYAHIGHTSTIEENAYVGKYAYLDSNVRIGRSTVVHDYVYLSRGSLIPANNVVVTATSSRLYTIAMQCTRQELVPEDDALFEQSFQSKTSRMLQGLSDGCDSTRAEQAMAELPCLADMYLRKYYGEDKYSEIKREFHQNWKLQSELNIVFHLGANATRRILSRATEQEFLKVIAARSDASRNVRLDTDTKCGMLTKILNNSVTVVTSQ